MAGDGLMTAQVKLLIELDQLDRAIHRARESRNQIRQNVAENKQKTVQLQETLDLLRDEKNTLEAEQRTKEQKLTQVEKKLKKIGDFSSVTSAKEYAAARKEVEVLTKSKGELEDAILEALERLDELGNEIETAEKKVENQKCQSSDAVKSWRADFDAEGKKILSYRKERAPLIDALDPEIRSLYARLLEKYKDRAVTTIVNDRCPPCRISVPPQNIVDILLGRAIHTCQHCGRFMLPEGEIK